MSVCTANLYSGNLEDINLLACFPVLTYLNAYNNKLSIIRDNKSKTGIYLWTNLTNGNFYVGS